MYRYRSLTLVGALLGIGLSACGGSDSTGSSASTTMDASEAADAGGAIGGLVEGAAGSMGEFTIDDGTLTDPSLSPGSAAARRKLPILAALRLGTQSHPEMGPATLQAGPVLGGCDVSPSNTTDTDHDGIYDDATYTFTTATCTYTNLEGDQVVVNGSIRIRDRGTIYGFLINFNNLRFDLTDGAASGSLTLAGSYAVTVGAQTATASHSMVVAFSNSRGSFDLSEAWTITFTPTGSISPSATHLPAGSFDMAGSLTLHHGARSWSLILVSTDPLVYDGTCAERPPFASGSLEGQIASVRSHGFHVEYNGCGNAATITALGSGS